MAKVSFSSVETIQYIGRSRLPIRKSMTVDQYESQRNKARQRHAGGPTRSRRSRKPITAAQRLRAKTAAPASHNVKQSNGKMDATVDNSATNPRKSKRNLKAALLRSRFASAEFADTIRASINKPRAPGKANTKHKSLAKDITPQEPVRRGMPFDDEDDLPTSDTSSETLSSQESSSNTSSHSTPSSIELELDKEPIHSSTGRHRFSRAMDSFTRRSGSFVKYSRRRFQARPKERRGQSKEDVHPLDQIPLLNIQDMATANATEITLVTPELQLLRLTSIDGNEPDEEDHHVAAMNEAAVCLSLHDLPPLLATEDVVGKIHGSLSSINCGLAASSWMDFQSGDCIGMRPLLVENYIPNPMV